MRKNKKIRKEKKSKSKNDNKNLRNLFVKELKLLFIIVFLFLIISIIYLINAVVLIYPNNNEVIYNRNPEFKWVGRYDLYKFYLSSDENFTNLIISEEIYNTNYKISDNLYFGDYYWKVIAVQNNRKISSSVNKLRIESLVATEINESLKNVGNTAVDVEILDKGGKVTGEAILDINEEMNAENNSLYKVRQNE